MRGPHLATAPAPVRSCVMMWNGYGMGGWGMAAMLVSSLFSGR
jgi:hypothetical protein